MPNQENIYDVMKRGAMWSVDKKDGRNWVFVARFRTKKEALKYVAGKGGNLAFPA